MLFPIAPASMPFVGVLIPPDLVLGPLSPQVSPSKRLPPQPVTTKSASAMPIAAEREEAVELIVLMACRNAMIVRGICTMGMSEDWLQLRNRCGRAGDC